MNASPLISIIMPVFNGAAHLPVSLASIRRQNLVGSELIIIDDGSTDDSAAVVRQLAPAAVYFHQKNAGCWAARNVGLARAQAPLVAFLDVDDEWPADALAALRRALAGHSGALFALGRTRFVPIANEPVPAPWVSPNLGAGLYRREVFTRSGNFDEGRRTAGDVEWFLRVREQGVPYVTIEEDTLLYRRRVGSLTAGKTWHDVGLQSAIRASLARRRQAAGGQAKELALLSGSKDDPRASQEVKHGSQERTTH